ncbi:unnamed protein product [Brassica rapa subsp. narinosa]
MIPKLIRIQITEESNIYCFSMMDLLCFSTVQGPGSNDRVT